jgi:hypothetical protein
MLIQLSSCSNYPLRQSHRHIYQASSPYVSTTPRILSRATTLLLPSRPGVTLPPSRHSCMGLCVVHKLHVACFMPPTRDSMSGPWARCWLVSLVGLVGKSAGALVVVMLVGGFCNTWALTGGGGWSSRCVVSSTLLPSLLRCCIVVAGV